MKHVFKGWKSVAATLTRRADADVTAPGGDYLNEGQRASLRMLATHLPNNGMIIADEVGMGKTRIAASLARAVIACGGRVAVILPSGLSYQWEGELRDAGIPVQPALRGMETYLDGWGGKDRWPDQKLVMLSHAFCNWALGTSTRNTWRWSLLPEVLARTRSKLPNHYDKIMALNDQRAKDAAHYITTATTADPQGPAQARLQSLHDDNEINTWGRSTKLLNAYHYRAGTPHRRALRQVVGLGLGTFDLILIDEAHKSRGLKSNLSELLDDVVVPSKKARRVAITATPVELDVKQWSNTLARIGLSAAQLKKIEEPINCYRLAVERVRNTWRSSDEARSAYASAAALFKDALSNYLIRRDKREDTHVQKFQELTGLSHSQYRYEHDITVGMADLSAAWRQGVCAAESLSLVSHYRNDNKANRLRLTMGSGYGIAAVLQQLQHDPISDNKQDNDSFTNIMTDNVAEVDSIEDTHLQHKRAARQQWWRNVLGHAFEQDGATLFDHPATKAAVTAIESATADGEKVLVFGRFTRPMRQLVDLLNAREMLSCVARGSPWPQEKIHGSKDGNADDSEWPAVNAAHRQFAESPDAAQRRIATKAPLARLDGLLSKSYNRARSARRTNRDAFLLNVEAGLQQLNGGKPSGDRMWQDALAIFKGLKVMRGAGNMAEGTNSADTLALTIRAVEELLGVAMGDAGQVPPTVDNYANAFFELVEALSDKDNADNEDETNTQAAAQKWKAFTARLQEEYSRTQGGFARLMYGQTDPHSRRMIQLAFNRKHNFPKVLVAQSMVGREGLNLHTACRIVVLLHPEWNPGVVEQQIGRVDRVGSLWSTLIDAHDAQAPGPVPQIEVRPVIFEGTYDEYNWKVLRERWDDLRAQLNGIIVPMRVAGSDADSVALVKWLEDAAPNFSPQRTVSNP